MFSSISDLQHLPLRYLLLALCLASTLGACEPIGDADSSSFDDCRVSEGTVLLEGAWKLSGSGDRYNCSASALDSEYTFALNTPIYIAQDGDELTLRDPIEGFELKGKVRGQCVDFETRETWKGEVIRRFYTGTVNFGDVEGTFSGDGPSFCNTDGSFSIEVN